MAIPQTLRHLRNSVYLQAKNWKDGFKQTLEDVGRFPYVSEKSVDGFFYKMKVGSRQEQEVVDGLYFEGELLRSMLSYIREGDVIHDIGAATGTHTIPIAMKTGKLGMVYAFEPDKECAMGLRENLALNQVRNAVVLETPLWRRDTTLILYTNGRAGDAPRVAETVQTVTKSFKSRLPISGRSMESLVQSGQVRPPNIVKIDVEGAGQDVLDGLGSLLPKHIFMEIHPTMGENREDTVKFLRSRGYQIVWESPRQEELHIHFQMNNAGAELPRFSLRG